jgi:uncharacterized membrane protein
VMGQGSNNRKGKGGKRKGGGKGKGKGKGGGTATGYGQGRRIMVQQDQHVPLNVKDVYRAWTEGEWPEFMHRVNTLDRQIEEDSARYAIGVKGLFFKKSFTAEVRDQVPFKYIVWSTTQGNIKNTGRVSFIELSDDLTLMVLNLDLAPSGLREKWVRGFRYHKRGIRGDFHRFSAWVQMRTQDELDELEGWLGTIKGGQITQTHEEYVDEHEEEQDRGGGGEEGEEQEGEDEPRDEAGEEGDEDEAEPADDEEEPSAPATRRGPSTTRRRRASQPASRRGARSNAAPSEEDEPEETPKPRARRRSASKPQGQARRTSARKPAGRAANR